MKDFLDIPRTAMEVFEILPEGTLCEVIDDAIYVLPTPTTTHQIILGDILMSLFSLIKESSLGTVLMRCDVYLNDGQNVVQPDILFVRKDRESIIQTKGIFGAPDLVIEILSTNKIHDQERKLELYRQNLVPEYIIVDPETKQVWHYMLENDAYTQKPNHDKGKLFIEQIGLELNF